MRPTTNHKSSLSGFIHLRGKGAFVEDRVNVRWSGFSQVAASLALLRSAYADPANSHFYLMSGQCFPVRSDSDIRAALAAGRGDFFDAVKMPAPTKPLRRLEEWHLADMKPSLLRRALQKFLSRLFPRNVGKLLNGVQPYGGSSWWLFSRPSVKKMLDFLNENPWFVDAFRFTLCPDEMFFQTLALHLGVAPERGTPTFTKWRQGFPHPATVTLEMLDEIDGTWCLMARKFDDPVLLERFAASDSAVARHP